jgi:hypothetical protein
MTRRNSKQNLYHNSRQRADRIAKLITEKWINDPIDIPTSAIPVDPHRINLGGSYFRPIYYEDLEFVCRDCGKAQTWKAEDQAWFYETSGAPYYSAAIRCRSCRKAENARKMEARKAAGHDDE